MFKENFMYSPVSQEIHGSACFVQSDVRFAYKLSAKSFHISRSVRKSSLSS
jgi:hypothetical protein